MPVTDQTFYQLQAFDVVTAVQSRRGAGPLRRYNLVSTLPRAQRVNRDLCNTRYGANFESGTLIRRFVLRVFNHVAAVLRVTSAVRGADGAQRSPVFINEIFRIVNINHLALH